MIAAKVLDVISRLPNCSGEANGAVSAYTEVNMKMHHKIVEITGLCALVPNRNTTFQSHLMFRFFFLVALKCLRFFLVQRRRTRTGQQGKVLVASCSLLPPSHGGRTR